MAPAPAPSPCMPAAAAAAPVACGSAEGRSPAHPGAARTAGFTLVECVMVCAIVGLLCTLMVVTGHQQTLRAGRLDAVDALTRIQQAQEHYRALHGMYSDDLAALRSAPAQSRQGRYQLQLQRQGGERYTAVATAQGAQHGDSACPVLTLAVDQGYPQAGPSAACWNR